jgi:tRNA/rRNA methyltransferase
MNLGQSVAVCLYELSRGDEQGDDEHNTGGVRDFPPFPQKQAERMGHGDVEVGPASSSATIDRLAGLIEETMTAAGYSPRVMQPANRHDLRLLLRRLAPSALDTRRMLGLFRRILYRLNRFGDPGDREPTKRGKHTDLT